ncbi:Creatininase [Haladaptatus paucihalophilus DX253]|uniref:Creatininase n=1 Tax=Haladaptatus paucihalophilus DX253 TaxID=797209 RepID=E7QPC9_HALPU|nr:creatininase family protein [Haladaptatus paucihalophilus]EFW94090.1 Creatininase [Haladaptatus paucihalophilus DX253]SHK62067.1 creatinine amidohydrolase [Haladaptatus paucihalophilus DX253]
MTTNSNTELAEHSWPEVEAALDDGRRTVIVAVGSVEQHGPHLPLIMDTLAGDELAKRIAEKLGDALAAPTVRPGCSGHHMEFPGTITIPAAVLMDLIRAYCKSLDEHGFEHIVLVPTHGGNFAPVNTVAPEVARDIDANVIALADLADLMELQNEGLRKGGVEYQEDVIHAGAAETAMVLAIDEGLVRTDELEVGHEEEISVSRLLSEGFQSITENGVLGDPREGTTEAGEEILDTVASAYAERIDAEREAI